MNPVKVYISAASGPAKLLRRVRWDEERYPTVVHQQVPRGLLTLTEQEDGSARGVWYSTLADYVLFPDGVELVSPTLEEIELAKEKVAVHCVRQAVNDCNYKSVAKVFLAKHRHARKEPTEFDAICAAAIAEVSGS